MVLRDALTNVAASARNATSAANDAVAAALNAGGQVGDAVVSAGTSVVGTVVETRDVIVDAVMDTKDTVVGVTKGVFRFTMGAVTFLSSVGIVVAAVVAPVPTFIGVTIIELLVIGAGFTSDNVSAELAEKRMKRQNGRLIERLARYGAIPATALIETKYAKFRLDINAGTVSGTLRSGSDIDTMTSADLASYAQGADEETRSLIEAYLKFRDAQGVL